MTIMVHAVVVIEHASIVDALVYTHIIIAISWMAAACAGTMHEARLSSSFVALQTIWVLLVMCTGHIGRDCPDKKDDRNGGGGGDRRGSRNYGDRNSDRIDTRDDGDRRGSKRSAPSEDNAGEHKTDEEENPTLHLENKIKQMLLHLSDKGQSLGRAIPLAAKQLEEDAPRHEFIITSILNWYTLMTSVTSLLHVVTYLG